MKQLGSKLTVFIKFYMSNFRNFVKKIQVSLKPDKKKAGSLHA